MQKMAFIDFDIFHQMANNSNVNILETVKASENMIEYSFYGF